jgi:uncharacterized protein involved in response to NO
MALIPLGEPVRRPPPGGFALWALGFRPFYLLAAAFAAIAISAWLFVLTGQLTVPMAGVWWHAHEMLFGFAAAVIVGFLFTAGRNWTGLATPTGTPLALLALLWLAGRLVMAFEGGWLSVLIDSAFLPAAATAIARVLWKAGSRRNYFVVGILGLLALANITFHLGRLGLLAIDPLRALHFALGVIVLLETTIGGRVIPSFTASALKGVRQWQSQAWDYASIAATGFALLAWVVVGEATWTAVVALVAASLQTVRALGWNPWATRRVPLLWILHLSHLWIPLGLTLLAASELGWLPRSAAVHALTIGATGGLIIGMITRTALGHTGRLLAAGRIETAAYALIQVAAVSRVLTIAAIPAASLAGMHFAATAWALAFLLYLWRYLPFLIRPRIDGQPG